MKLLPPFNPGRARMAPHHGSSLKKAIEIYMDGKVIVMDDYQCLEIPGGEGAGMRTTIQDKAHRAELEAFHRLVTGEGEAPMTLEEMVEVTEMTLALRDQLRLPTQ